MAGLSLGAGLVTLAIVVATRLSPEVRRAGLLIVFGLIVAMAGVITGIVALIRASKSGHTVRELGTALGGILLSGFFGLFIIEFAMPRGRIYEPLVCPSNLVGISTALSTYRDNDQDEFPDSIEGIYQYMPVPERYVCPYDRKPMVIPDSFRYKERFPEGGLKCSYHYVGRLSSQIDGGVILIYENAGNHSYEEKGNRGQGRHVIFADGHVDILPEELFQAWLRESLDLVKQVDWDSCSPERQAEIEAFYQDGLSADRAAQ